MAMACPQVPWEDQLHLGHFELPSVARKSSLVRCEDMIGIQRLPICLSRPKVWVSCGMLSHAGFGYFVE